MGQAKVCVSDAITPGIENFPSPDVLGHGCGMRPAPVKVEEGETGPVEEAVVGGSEGVQGCVRRNLHSLLAVTTEVGENDDVLPYKGASVEAPEC
jgi:hypothetical protein